MYDQLVWGLGSWVGGWGRGVGISYFVYRRKEVFFIESLFPDSIKYEPISAITLTRNSYVSVHYPGKENIAKIAGDIS